MEQTLIRRHQDLAVRSIVLSLVASHLEAGACVTCSEVLYAVRHGDPDIVAFVLPKRSDKLRGTVGDYVVAALQVFRDSEIRIMVEKRIQRDKTDTTKEHSHGCKDDQEKARNNTDAVGEEWYEKRSNPNKSWWQIWR